MKELYESTKQFILKNYKGKLDDEALDILTVSTMSLFVNLEAVSRMKLPEVFDKLEIHFGDKHITELVLERYPEYPIKEISQSTDAFVIRALALGDDNKFSEEWSMYISTSTLSKNMVNVIAKSAHELIHLLRFNGIVDSPTDAKIRDGVSVARCNKATHEAKRKHYRLEEGIVEFYTIQSMESLFEFVKNEDVSFSPALSTFKNRFKKDFSPAYEVERFYLEGLTRSAKFSELLDYSFVDTSEPLQLVTYFNNSVGNSSAFTLFSRGLDRVVDYAHQNDFANFEKSSTELISQVNEFLSKAKR